MIWRVFIVLYNFSVFVEEESSPSDGFHPSFKPNAQIVYENTPLTKSTIRPEKCPLYGKISLFLRLNLFSDKASMSIVTKADVISAISKGRGNDLASTKGTWELGSALRVAKTISKR